MSQSYDRLSLWGMYQYDDTILDNLHVPAELNSELENIKSNILISAAELELYYTDFDFLKSAIGVWSNKKVANWKKIYDALTAQYNPIENYDRIEDWTDTRNTTGTRDTEDITSFERLTTGSNQGTQTVNGTNSETTTSGGTSQLDVNSFDSGAYTPKDKTTASNNGTLSGTASSTTTGSNSESGSVNDDTTRNIDEDTTEHSTFEHHARVHGNIGVMTNQKMITESIELYTNYNMTDIITNDFIEAFCLRVY